MIAGAGVITGWYFSRPLICFSQEPLPSRVHYSFDEKRKAANRVYGFNVSE
jgi:hypothetical protein